MSNYIDPNRLAICDECETEFDRTEDGTVVSCPKDPNLEDYYTCRACGETLYPELYASSV